MPTFEGVEITTTADVDFEVFCGTCGAGLCSQSSTRSSRHRGAAQVTVDACDTCLEAAREEVRSELEQKIEELEAYIVELEANQCQDQ